jgi:hypothetical protein
MSRGYPIVTPGLAVDAQVVDASWRSFTPRVTIVGAGTPPNYLVNSGRFMVANNVVHCDVLLDGNGGTAGSGAGVVNVSLPVLPSPLRLPGLVQVGSYVNAANGSILLATLSTTSVFASLSRFLSVGGGSPAFESFTDAMQDNASRTVRLHFWYEADLLDP